MNNMEIKDLKLGDVLLFSPEEGSWISKAITWLTDAPVSHTAMTYQMYSKLIEETPPAVRVADANQRFVERTIYVMRFNQEVENFDPVMAAAKNYLNQLEPYAMSNLYIVGMLLLYKKLTPSDSMQKVTLKILKLLTKDLLEAINRHEYPNKLPMVCSQFVFQCYKEAGVKYQLNIKNGSLLKSAKHPSLLNHAFKHKPNLAVITSSLNAAVDKSIDDRSPEDRQAFIEELGRELYEHNSEDALLATGNISEEVLNGVHQFAHALHAMISKTQLDKASSSQGIALLQAQESLFVTPGDLLLHCPQLSRVGEIKIQ